MKKIILFILLIVFSLAGSAQTSETKRKLDITLIDYVELVKLNTTNPSTSEKKRLAATQYVDFAGKWNGSRSIGADKFKIHYYIYVYLKDGSKRQFTIGGSKVQEQSWMTMDFGNKLYFDKLWKAIP